MNRQFMIGMLCVAMFSGVVHAELSIERKHGTMQRMEPAHLAASKKDTEAYQAKRRPFEDMASMHSHLGVQDYRAIFHVHAGDSNHTGGTPEELLRGAKETGVEVVFLSDHFRPPQDFMDGWRGVKDGVLFVPGSEAHGFLVHPDASVFKEMSGPKEDLIKAVNEGTGMLFLSHVESKVEDSMEGVIGIEIYNRHYDAMNDYLAMVMNLAARMTEPESAQELVALVAEYPDGVFAAQYDYPQVYMDKWDAETQHKRIVGVGANDCHHNNVLTLKMKDETTAIFGTNIDDDDEMQELPLSKFSGLAKYFEHHKPGDILAELDIDPYPISIGNVSTHILASDLREVEIRDAVAKGHVYVSHDWLCDPKGFMTWLVKDGEPVASMGDEVTFSTGYTFRAELPVKAHLRLIRNGEVVDEARTASYRYRIKQAGVYRLEAWLKVDEEWLGWIYANPIYVR